MMRVLLVDDNVDHLHLMERALKSLSEAIAVETATSGADALAWLQGNGFDVVVLDQRLPDGDGLSFLREIIRRRHSVEVVMVTGDGSEQVAVEALKAGAADYLAKSGNYLRLLPATVEQAAARRGQKLERERLAREAAEAEALRCLAEIKDTFLGRVSHELRTPLTTIVGYSELLARGQLPPAKVQETVEQIRDTAWMLARLVDQLIEAAGMAQVTRLQIAETRLEPLLAAAVDRHRAVSSHHSIVYCPGEPLPPVWVDQSRLARVLDILLSNASRYSPDGGQIEVASAIDGDAVHVTVRDQGVGIATEHLPRVFEKLYRIETDLAHREHGLGLGLFFARAIVEAHGGHIWAESKGPGRGSTFHFTLPIRRRSHP